MNRFIYRNSRALQRAPCFIKLAFSKPLTNAHTPLHSTSLHGDVPFTSYCGSHRPLITSCPHESYWKVPKGTFQRCFEDGRSSANFVLKKLPLLNTTLTWTRIAKHDDKVLRPFAFKGDRILQQKQNSVMYTKQQQGHLPDEFFTKIYRSGPNYFYI